MAMLFFAVLLPIDHRVKNLLPVIAKLNHCRL